MARMRLGDLREGCTEIWSKVMYGEGDGFGDTLEGVFVLETVCDVDILEDVPVPISYRELCKIGG